MATPCFGEHIYSRVTTRDTVSSSLFWYILIVCLIHCLIHCCRDLLMLNVSDQTATNRSWAVRGRRHRSEQGHRVTAGHRRSDCVDGRAVSSSAADQVGRSTHAGLVILLLGQAVRRPAHTLDDACPQPARRKVIGNFLRKHVSFFLFPSHSLYIVVEPLQPTLHRQSYLRSLFLSSYLYFACVCVCVCVALAMIKLVVSFYLVLLKVFYSQNFAQ